MMQALYCESDFSRCERYKLASAGTMPPGDLLPNGERLQPKTPST